MGVGGWGVTTGWGTGVGVGAGVGEGVGLGLGVGVGDGIGVGVGIRVGVAVGADGFACTDVVEPVEPQAARITTSRVKQKTTRTLFLSVFLLDCTRWEIGP